MGKLGKPSGLKIRRPYGLVGSIPTSGTKISRAVGLEAASFNE